MEDSPLRVVVSCRWMSTRFEVYLEVGAKRVFACAVDWPGWCRSGGDEATALRALLDSGPRYAAVIRSARLGFEAPTRLEAFRVVERLAGNATTDFGAPGVIPSADRPSASPAECVWFEKVLRAGWRALDAARKRATGLCLRPGLSRRPRVEGPLVRGGPCRRNPDGDHRGDSRVSPWRDPREGPSRREPVARPLLCAARCLACHRSCVGDRAPEHL
jgi:hypothetical protein